MHDDDKEVVAKVVPIATSFDLRVVAAPAVAIEVSDWRQRDIGSLTSSVDFLL